MLPVATIQFHVETDLIFHTYGHNAVGSCPFLSQSTVGMDKVFQHHAHTFEKSNLNFHFQCEFSSVIAEW